MGKRGGVHTHRAMSLSRKEGDITPCPATRKEVETILQSDVKKTEEDKHMLSLGGEFYKWIQMNFFTKHKQPHNIAKCLLVTQRESGGQRE